MMSDDGVESDRPTTVEPLHERITISHMDGSANVARRAFLRHQIDGTEPFVRAFTIDRPIAPVAVLPGDASILRCVTTDSSVVVVAALRSGGHVLIDAQLRSADVIISTPTRELLEAAASSMAAVASDTSESGKTSLRTWHLVNHERAAALDRRIETPTWASIERNYTARVRESIEQLMQMDRPSANGKLILWHGEPGTGKTTALRALLRAWEPWCAGQYIADAEEFFTHPSYIADVLSRATAPQYGPTLTKTGDPDSLWRLIIAEDADQYLRASARRDSGTALGRLLNLADGILGQGYNTLILLTTNEELSRLHPAIIRPGRCLARVEFDRFTVEEARGWLPEGVRPPAGGASLAELFECAGTISRIDRRDGPETLNVGQYL